MRLSGETTNLHKGWGRSVESQIILHLHLNDMDKGQEMSAQQ